MTHTNLLGPGPSGSGPTPTQAAAAIGEDPERDRCLQFLRDSDPAAAGALT